MISAGYSGFLHYLQLASHELPTNSINVMKNEIPNTTLTYLHSYGCLFSVATKLLSPNSEHLLPYLVTGRQGDRATDWNSPDIAPGAQHYKGPYSMVVSNMMSKGGSMM